MAQKKLPIFLTMVVSLLILIGKSKQQSCSDSQFQINSQCVECSGVLFGCRSCAFSNVVHENQTVSGLQCTACDFGMYLLKISNTTSIDNTSSILSMCLPRCEDYSYQYVSNPNTRQCECKLIFFCDLNSKTVGLIAPNVLYRMGALTAIWIRGFFLTKSYYTLAFPYNTIAQPSVNFSTCQNCSVQSGVNGRCDSCYNYNQTSCESCYGYVNGWNSTYETSMGGCQLCTNNTYNNCMQCNTTNTSQCLLCNNGFYLNSSKACTQCTQNGCSRCTNASVCLDCNKAFFYNTTTKACTQCQVSPSNPWTYELQDYRCTQCNGSTTAQTKVCQYCDLGFQHSTLNTQMSNLSCQLKCGISQYPMVAFQSINNNDNLIKSTNCSNCSTSCYSCIGGGADQCTQCFVGQYLSITDTVRRSGTCLNKMTAGTTPSFDIYVSNLDADYQTSPLLRTGSQTYPFIDLQDALVRGKELASQYAQTVQINIYMYSGVHYLLQNRGDSAQIYQPTQYFDPYNLNYEVYINPLGCNPSQRCTAAQVEVYNKRREAFVIDVAVKLHMRSVIIDSIDSMLPQGNTCLGQRRSCCVANDTGIFNVLTSDTFTCSSIFTSLNLNLQCQINMPRTMFRMRLNNQSQIVQPNNLTLENCMIRNVFYDMNSLVNFTEYGGYVKLYNTRFQRITMCGSIIKNYYTGYPLEDYSQLDDSSGFSALGLSYLTKMRRIAQSYYDSYYDEMFRVPAVSPFTSCPLGLCYDVDIRGSYFTQVPYMMSSQTALNVVSNDGGVRYQGSIINLISFKGHINIQDSNFANNRFNFDGCEAISSSMTESPTSLTVKNNFSLLRLSQATFNLYQLESLINIMDHANKIFFYGNTFTNNIALKGLINLEVNRPIYSVQNAANYHILLFYQNTFTNNSAIFESNVLNVRVVNNRNLLGTTYTDTSDLGCGGVDINRNTFLNNYGCQDTNGAIYLYCYDKSHSSNNSVVKYVQSWDSQYFISQSGNSTLTQGDKSLIPSVTYRNLYTTYLFNNNTPTTEVFSNSNLQWCLLRNNVFRDNLAGSNKQIVQIEGFVVNQFRNDYYKNNFNWLPNIFRMYSIIFQQQTNKTLPIPFSEPIQRSSFTSFTLKAQSIATLVRALFFNLRNTTFDGNYISDTNVTDSKKSNSLLFIDFYGYMNFNESSAFQNHYGLRSIDKLSTLVDFTTVLPGFRSSLINYNRAQFAQYLISNVKFTSNVGRFDTTTSGAQVPYLFIINQDLMAPNFSYLFDSVTVTNNTFYNCYGMIYLDIKNLIITNSIFSQNNQMNDETNNGLLVLRLDDSYVVNMQNNTFKDIYTSSNMSSIYFELRPTSSSGFTTSIQLYNNSFDNIITSSTSASVAAKGSPVIFIESSLTQKVLTGALNIVLNVTLCSFKNIRAAPDMGVIHQGDSWFQSTSYSIQILSTDVTVSNITQGHYLKIGDKKLTTSSSFTQLVSLNRVTASNMNNGSVVELGQYSGNVYSVDRTCQILNSQFTNFANGSALYRKGQSLTVTQNYDNKVIYNSNIFKNLYNGSALYVVGDDTVVSGSNMSFVANITNQAMDTLGLAAINLVSAIYKGSANMNYQFNLLNSQFQNISSNILFVQNLNISVVGNVTILKTFDTLSMNTILRSPIRFGDLNISSSTGSFGSVSLIQNTNFDNVNNTIGAIAIISRYITSNLQMSERFQVLNCRFANYSTGNAISLGPQTFIAQNGAITETNIIQNCQFSNFTAGNAIVISSKSVATLGAYTFLFYLKNLKFTLFSQKSAVDISSSVIQASTISDTFQMENSTFSQIAGNGFGISFNQGTATGQYYILKLITDCSFSDIGQNGVYFGSNGSNIAVSYVNRTHNVTRSTFRRIGFSAVNISGVSATSTTSEIKSIVALTDSIFDSTAKSALHYGPRNMNSASLLSSIVEISNCSFSYCSNNSIYFDQMTSTNKGRIELIFSILNSVVKHIVGFGMYNGGYSLTPSADVSIYLQAQNNTIQNTSSSGIQIGSIAQTGGVNLNLTSYIFNNSFQLIGFNAFHASTFDSSSATGTGYFQQTFMKNTFDQVTSNGIYIDSRTMTSQGQITVNNILQSNTLTSIGASGFSYKAQTLTSSGQVIQTESLIENQFFGCGSDGISIPQRVISTQSSFSHTLNIAQSTFRNIKGNGISVGAFQVTSATGYTRVLSLNQNTFTSIGMNGVLMSSQNIQNTQGTVTQNFQWTTLTFQTISLSAISLGSRTFNSGSATVSISNLLEDIQMSDISVNGLFNDAFVVKTTSTAVYLQNITSCQFANIGNSSVVYTLLDSQSSSLDANYLLQFITMSKVIQGAGLDLGRLSSTTTDSTGLTFIRHTLQHSTLNYVQGSQYGYGMFVGNSSVWSQGTLTFRTNFLNNTLANIYLRGMHFNSTTLGSQGELLQNVTLNNNNFNNITSYSALYYDNQSLSSNQSLVTKLTTVRNNIFTNLGRSSYSQTYLNVPSTAANYNQTFIYVNNTVTTTGDSGVTVTGGDFVNVKGNYYYNLLIDNCTLADQQQRGIFFNLSTIVATGNINFTSTITSSSFSNDQSSAVSFQNFTYNSGLDIIETYLFQKLTINNMIKSRGIFFNSRDFDSLGQIISSFKFDTLNISNIQQSQGIDKLNQSLNAQKLIQMTYLIQSCTFNNILVGSGFRMTKNTLQSNDSVIMSMLFISSTFTNINSQGDGASLYINNEQCQANNTQVYDLEMQSMTFKNIQEGGALKFREFNSYSKKSYSYTITINSSTIDTVTSGVGVIILKDTIKSDSDYTSQINIINNSKFNNIQSLNGNPAIQLQEAYILSKGNHNTQIKITDTSLSNINKGPALIINSDRIESNFDFSSKVYLQNTQFINMTATSNTSVGVQHTNIKVESDYTQELTVTSCTFQNILVGSSLRIFDSNLTAETGLFSKTYDFESSVFTKLQTNELAAIIVWDNDIVLNEKDNVNKLTFNKCNFTSNVGNLVTSSVFIDSGLLLVATYTKCIFKKNNGLVTNELYARIIDSLQIDQCTWSTSTNNENQAQFILKDIYDYGLSVTRTSFDCGITYSANSILTYDNTNLKTMASLFNFRLNQEDPSDDPTNYFSSNTFTYCNQIYKGAIYRISNGSQVYDFNSSYSFNSALYGGVAYAENQDSLVIIDTPKLVQKNNAFYGGFLYILQQANASLINPIFTQLTASEGAIAYALDRCFLSMTSFTIKSSVAYRRGMLISESGSWFDLDYGSVQLNTAYQESVLAYVVDATDIVTFSNSATTSLNRITCSIKNLNIFQNEVTYGGKLISISGGNLRVENCQIYKNYIYQDTEGIFAVSAKLWISNTRFSENYQTTYYTQLANRQLGDMNGAYLSIGRNSTVYINSTSFTNGRGVYGGCIAIQGTSQTYIFNSTFTSCSALLGGGIYASNVDSLTIDTCKFTQNVGFRGYGVNIYIINNKLNLTLLSSSFSNYHNSVYLRDGLLLYMKNNVFLNETLRAKQIPLQEYAGGIHIINTVTVTMTGYNNFTYLKGSSGGAIYLSLDMNYKNLYTQVAATFEGLQIIGCQASADGGALYLRNIKSVSITNSRITLNKAVSGNGGAIQFICYQSWSDVCDLYIKQTQITYNTARIGGGVRFNWVAPIVDSFSTVSNNVGTLYGQDYASYARELVLLEDSDAYLKYFNKGSLEKINVRKTLTAFTYSNVQSGGYIPTQYMALVDDQGQVVSTNSGGMIRFDVNQITINNFTTEMSGVNKFFSTYGVFNVSGLLIVAAPNSTQTLNLTVVDAVDLTVQSNQKYLRDAYGKTTNITNYLISVTLIIRGCIKGEGLTDSGACYTCPKGTYLLQAPLVPTECKVCSAQKAICNGGSNIGPQPGYWRKDNETDNFIACYLPASCLGMILPDLNPVGDCNDGTYGVLCTACMPGYSRSGDYGCSKCPPPLLNILRIAGILVAIVIVLVLMVRSTINSASKKSGYSVFTKILTNHLQLLTICSSFKFQWPSIVTTFFSSGSFISSSQESIVSFDCQMDNRLTTQIQRYRFSNDPGEVTVLYMKMMIYAALPIIICCTVAITWLIYLKRKKQMEQLEIRFVASVVIIFFLVHPTITQQMINLFNCQNFDGDLRLMKDLQVICYTDIHVYMVYFLAVPCIGLWGIGIPAAVWYLMTKDKEKLDTLAVKQKFGFLYNGYKRTNFFWEIVIMYRKILLIGLSVFLNRIGTVVQALVLLIVLVCFLQLNNMRRPFANRSLNDIEDLSLFAGIITIYCAIFFISSRDPTSASYDPNSDFTLNETTKLILFVAIMAFNIAFFVTWFFKFIAVARLAIKEKQPKLYVALFLCCRQDKLERENEQLAKVTKRETIIEKIEEIQFFLKGMKNMYTRQIFYEGHQKFLRMLYFIETEKATIDMTEKKHNFYIQGKMARDRKFDPERMAEVLDQRILSIESDSQFAGKQAKDDSSKQILTQMVSEFDGKQEAKGKGRNGKPSGKQRRESFKLGAKSGTVGGRSSLSKVGISMDEGSRSPQSSKSGYNTGDRFATGIPGILGNRRNGSQLQFYGKGQDLDETNNLFENSEYGMDDTQYLNGSQRNLLNATQPKFVSQKRQNYIYNASSGSNQNIKGFVSGSGIIYEDSSQSGMPTQPQNKLRPHSNNLAPPIQAVGSGSQTFSQIHQQAQNFLFANLQNSVQVGISGIVGSRSSRMTGGLQQDEQLNTEERIKKYRKKQLQPLEDRIERSRNAFNKLNKGKKKHIEIKDVDESRDQLVSQEENFARDGLEQDYTPGDILHTENLDFSKLENYYFGRGKQGIFDTDAFYEEDSVREKRLMRGLTKRLMEANTKSGNKNQKSPKRQRGSTQKVASQKKQQTDNKNDALSQGKSSAKMQPSYSRASSVAGASSGRREELQISFLPPPEDASYFNKRGAFIQANQKALGLTGTNQYLINTPQEAKGATEGNPLNIIKELASSILKTMSQTEKQLTVEEILRQTRLGKKWKEELNHVHKLRSHEAPTRELIINEEGGFMQIRDQIHQVEQLSQAFSMLESPSKAFSENGSQSKSEEIKIESPQSIKERRKSIVASPNLLSAVFQAADNQKKGFQQMPLTQKADETFGLEKKIIIQSPKEETPKEGAGDFSMKINKLFGGFKSSNKTVKMTPTPDLSSSQTPSKSQQRISFAQPNSPENKVIIVPNLGQDSKNNVASSSNSSKKRKGTVRGTIITIKDYNGEVMTQDRLDELMEELKQKQDPDQLLITLDSELE